MKTNYIHKIHQYHMKTNYVHKIKIQQYHMKTNYVHKIQQYHMKTNYVHKIQQYHMKTNYVHKIQQYHMKTNYVQEISSTKTHPRTKTVSLLNGSPPFQPSALALIQWQWQVQYPHTKCIKGCGPEWYIRLCNMLEIHHCGPESLIWYILFSAVKVKCSRSTQKYE